MLEYRQGDYTITTDRKKLDLSMVHQYLSEQSYWAKDRPLDVVKTSIEHSLCFGVFTNTIQIGFARVITDYATFAYLADVFVLEEHRGKGLGKWLMACIINHPDIAGISFKSTNQTINQSDNPHGYYRRTAGDDRGSTVCQMARS